MGFAQVMSKRWNNHDDRGPRPCGGQEMLERRHDKRALAGLGTVLAGLVALSFSGAALAADEAEHPKEMEWSFEGPLGTFDRPALQRGFQVFKEVCSTCHTLKYVTFGSLDDAGGPGFSEAEAKAVAAEYEKDALDDSGDVKQVPRTLADTFPAPFANDLAARAANGGALPPDLSVMTKARHEGPSYIYSLLTGYKDAPADVEMRAGMNYNPYFPTHQIAMPPPLTPDRVTYSDGTPATVEQMAHDVVTFLEWTAEPKLEARKRTGLTVLIYLALLSVMLYWAKSRIWKDAH